MQAFLGIESNAMEIITNSAEQTYTLGIDFGEKIKSKGKGVKLGFIGDLGAGKTLFIKGLMSTLLPNITVTSPTYTLINVYEGEALTVHHVDLYRINDPEELVMCGFYEILNNTDSTVLIEWYDKISKTVDLGNDIITIEIEPLSENERRIFINE
jgi:tRNA threonylcarbamoyladenosine biosynthesis protein TsaE